MSQVALPQEDGDGEAQSLGEGGSPGMGHWAKASAAAMGRGELTADAGREGRGSSHQPVQFQGAHVPPQSW